MIRYSRNFLSRLARPSMLGPVSSNEASEFSTWSKPNVDDAAAKRTYAQYAIYKGKAALGVDPALPKFVRGNLGDYFVKKGGAVILTFSPACGQMKYDHSKKQLFALSPTEVGRLISLAAGESCEFFHDPSMKSSNEGQVRKTLSVTPTSTDGGYFFNLTVSNVPQNSVERFSVPVSKAEFSVLRTSFSFILPHIMGWARIVAEGLPQPSQQAAPGKAAAHQLSRDMEWNR